MLRKLPDEVSDQEAAMIEPTAIGYHALKLAQIQAGDKVLVTGNGPIGILTAASAKALGASLVVVTGRTEERLTFARAQPYIDAAFATDDPEIIGKLQDITGGLGFDLAVEATGLQDPTDLCVKALKIGGKLAIVGTHGPITFNIPFLLSKAIKITGDMLFLPEDYDEIIELLATKKLDIISAATSVISLDEVEENLIGKKNRQPGNQDVKILVKIQ
jgi:threonine dehydrogenase-like Zn-dependent dehydrogenase